MTDKTNLEVEDNADLVFPVVNERLNVNHLFVPSSGFCWQWDKGIDKHNYTRVLMLSNDRLQLHRMRGDKLGQLLIILVGSDQDEAMALEKVVGIASTDPKREAFKGNKVDVEALKNPGFVFDKWIRIIRVDPDAVREITNIDNHKQRLEAFGSLLKDLSLKQVPRPKLGKKKGPAPIGTDPNIGFALPKF